LVAQLLMAALAAPSWAALGDGAASVSDDAQQLRASPQVTARAAYSVHEFRAPTGTVIREFVSPAGVVFAVSWQGPFKPNLPLLMGRHYADYVNAERAPGSTRTHSKIEQPNLIVRAEGHMRSFAGLAVLPQLMPANVNEGELR
jgi:Protein of unknown function (DUF2844)